MKAHSVNMGEQALDTFGGSRSPGGYLGRIRLPHNATVLPPDLGLGPSATMAREIPARTHRQTMPGWFPTSKSDRGTLRAETTLEMDGFALFETDSCFVQLAAQPHELQYSVSVNGRLKRVRYYPDLIALRSDGGIIVVDFKTDVGAKSTDWVNKAAIVREIYEALGVRFETLRESVVRREPRLSNVKLLLRHRPSGGPIDPQTEAMIWRIMDAAPVPEVTLGDIVGSDCLDLHSCAESRALTTFAQLVLSGLLTIDMNSEISTKSKVRPRWAAVDTLSKETR